MARCGLRLPDFAGVLAAHAAIVGIIDVARCGLRLLALDVLKLATVMVGIIDVAFAAGFELKWLAIWIYSELNGLW